MFCFRDIFSPLKKTSKILGFDIHIQDKFQNLSSTTETGLAPESI